jgi:formylglycine-generating enzyme required for sulfatase activity/DNA-binding SARP family transcriptional activator
MDRIEIHLLGAPEVRRTGRAVRLERKPLALLAWLAVTGTPARRDSLAALLWPESPQAGVNLRKAVWTLAQALGRTALVVMPENSTVALSDEVWSDTAAFEALVASAGPRSADDTGAAALAALAEAARLVRGEFLAGMTLADSLQFDDWQALQRERFTLRTLEVLDRLSESLSLIGQHDAAGSHALRRLELDPEDEAGYRQAMRVLARAGQKGPALRQYAACRRMLGEAFALEPDAETEALHADILAGRLAVPRPVPLSAAAVTTDGFLGRVQVLARPVEVAASGGGAPARRGSGADGLLAAVLDPQRDARLAPEELARLARQTSPDLTSYYLSRVAAWCQPAYRLDRRFVALTLLVDRGEEAISERWAPEPTRYDDLGVLLAARSEPALVVLGAPGAGKSTLLRRLELDAALASMRENDGRVSFLVGLNAYPGGAAGTTPDPLAWLAELWAAQQPHLPGLVELLKDGRVLLLLDGLNELPHADGAGYRRLVAGWRAFLASPAVAQAGNRVVFSCRALEYSAPLSSNHLPVPQVRVEPLSDTQIEAFIAVHAPEHATAVRARLADPQAAELFRSPFFLRLLADQTATGDLPNDRADLLTRLVWQALAREVARANELLSPDGAEPLLAERDHERLALVTARLPELYALPERGPLLGRVSDLAYGMQSGRSGGEAHQVRVPYDDALALAHHPRAADVLKAGMALGLLEDDPARDAIQFSHQLLQEYFAGRRVACSGVPIYAHAAWRSTAARPSLAATLQALDPSDSLPPMPASGWEETLVLAAAMSPAPDDFLAQLAAADLPLAGRAAAELTARPVGPRPGAERLARLRAELLARARDPAADLRARIRAGLALGPLGDPRLVRQTGPHGDWLAPELVDFAGGPCAIGGDAAYDYLGRELTAHTPRHRLPLTPYALGRCAVTNAEWALFMAGGGYDEPAWWATATAQAWRAGQGTAEGSREAVRYWLRHFRARPDLLAEQYARGELTDEAHALWQRRLGMSARVFAAHLAEIAPDRRHTEPAFWREPAFHNPTQPVVGISWYEARAYCAWLALQSGQAFRLPNEAEWEWAAAGRAARRYAWGDDYDPLRANVTETRLRRTTPVGVFPEGDTPEGLSDMTGNTWDWTASLWGDDTETPAFGYPYDSADGREDSDAPQPVRRIVRGGAWVNSRISARTAYRGKDHPADRTNLHGLRLACDR